MVSTLNDICLRSSSLAIFRFDFGLGTNHASDLMITLKGFFAKVCAETTSRAHNHYVYTCCN